MGISAKTIGQWRCKLGPCYPRRTVASKPQSKGFTDELSGLLLPLEDKTNAPRSLSLYGIHCTEKPTFIPW